MQLRNAPKQRLHRALTGSVFLGGLQLCLIASDDDSRVFERLRLLLRRTPGSFVFECLRLQLRHRRLGSPIFDGLRRAPSSTPATSIGFANLRRPPVSFVFNSGDLECLRFQLRRSRMSSFSTPASFKRLRWSLAALGDFVFNSGDLERLQWSLAALGDFVWCSRRQ